MDSSALEIEAFKEGIARLEKKLASTTEPGAREALELRLVNLREQLESRTSGIPKIQRKAVVAPQEVVPAPVPREEHLATVASSLAPKPTVESPPDALLGEPSAQQLDQVEKLLREAQVERMRGNKARTTELVTQAAKIAPDAPSVLSVLADTYLESRQTKKALEVLKRVVELDPTNIAAERKYAELVLRSGPLTDEALRRALSDSPFIGSEDVVASGRAAMLLSVVLPGAGQFVLGQSKKGLTFFFGWLICAFLLFLLREDLLAILGIMGLRPRGGESHGSPNYFVLVPAIGAVGFHLTSILSAMTLGKTSSISISKEKPVPPVNMPFE